MYGRNYKLINSFLLLNFFFSLFDPAYRLYAPADGTDIQQQNFPSLQGICRPSTNYRLLMGEAHHNGAAVSRNQGPYNRHRQSRIPLALDQAGTILPGCHKKGLDGYQPRSNSRAFGMH